MLSAAMASWGHYQPTVVKKMADGTQKVMADGTQKIADSTVYSEAMAAQSPNVKKEGERVFSVVPKMMWDAAKGIEPNSFQYAICEDGSDAYVYYALWEYDVVIMEWNLPEGTYDFLFTFNSPEGLLLVTKEGVTVDEDSVIEVDAEDAKVSHIEWRPMLPDGTAPIEDYDSGEEYIACTCVCHKNLDAALGLNIFEINGDIVSQENADIWTNASGRFLFGQTVSCVKGAGQYYINMPAVGVASQMISNGKNDFTLSFSPTAPKNWYDVIGTEHPLTYPYMNWQWRWNGDLQWNYSTISNIDREEYVNTCYYCETAPFEGYKMTIQPWMTDVTYNPSGENDLYGTFGIELPSLIFSTEENSCRCLRIFGSSFDGLYSSYDYDSARMKLNVENPYFAIPEGTDPVFGGDAPFVLFTRPDPYFGYTYVGRYGEIRSLDYLYQNFSIRLNGEVVWNDYLHLDEFYYNTDDWTPGIAYEPGVWDYEIETGNVIVDGLKSATRCSMHFADADSGTWPTLTALQLRTKENMITDRFTAADNGKMIFSGGEWSCRADGPGYDCVAPEEVTVEYAPYGSDDYLPLDCRNVAEKRFMPAYGEYYEADLAGVTVESPSGWYGVRITMTDHSGNVQCQSLTPAFHLDKVSDGVSNIVSDKTAVKVSGSDIITPEGALIYASDGRRVTGKSSPAGIYMVVCNGRPVKVAVK